MDDAFDDGCGGDHGDESCPICRGEELDPDFVSRITAAAAQPGRMMTIKEFNVWLEQVSSPAEFH